MQRRWKQADNVLGWIERIDVIWRLGAFVGVLVIGIMGGLLRYVPVFYAILIVVGAVGIVVSGASLVTRAMANSQAASLPVAGFAANQGLIAQQIDIDLYGNDPIQLQMHSTLPQISITFKFANRSEVNLFLDRMIVDVWLANRSCSTRAILNASSLRVAKSRMMLGLPPS
jgi:hypothetical protein